MAPIFIQENPEDPTSSQKLKGFRVVYVFDISQTEGEPLPEPPNWKSPEKQLNPLPETNRIRQTERRLGDGQETGREHPGVKKRRGN